MDRKRYISEISSLVNYFEGYGTLALILNVNVDELRRWAEGSSRPPAEVSRRIVSLSSSLMGKTVCRGSMQA